MHFPKKPCERPRYPSRAAADLKNPHLFRVPALADVGHVGQNLLADVRLATGEIVAVGPRGGATVYVEFGVQACAGVPIRTHPVDHIGRGRHLAKNGTALAAQLIALLQDRKVRPAQVFEFGGEHSPLVLKSGMRLRKFGAPALQGFDPSKGAAHRRKAPESCSGKRAKPVTHSR